MMTKIFALVALAASVAAFQPHQFLRPYPTLLRSTPREEENKPSFDLDKLKSSFDLDKLKANLPDVSDLTKISDKIRENALGGGEFGARGEGYVVAQVALILLVALGDVPIIGGALRGVLGPGLMLVGAAIIVAGTTELGTALSPWPVPAAKNNSDLVVTGIYSKVRHPIYAGLLAACVGLSVVTESPTRLLLTAALWYVFDLKSDFEEDQLDAVYPEYRAYKTEVTGKFFPQEILDAMPWNNRDE